jgi:hypothetical protein
MGKILAVALTACYLAAMASPVQACRRAPFLPEPGVAERFSAILAVEATGVHLTAYEFHQLVRRGIKEAPRQSDGIGYIYPTSSTPSFDVHVLVDSVVRGESEPARQFTLGGCGMAIPNLREKGLVFVDSSGKALALWASQGSEYVAWAKELGLQLPDEP